MLTQTSESMSLTCDAATNVFPQPVGFAGLFREKIDAAIAKPALDCPGVIIRQRFHGCPFSAGEQVVSASLSCGRQAPLRSNETLPGEGT